MTSVWVANSTFTSCSSLLDPGMRSGSGKNCTVLDVRGLPVDFIRQMYDLYVSMAAPKRNPTSPCVAHVSLTDGSSKTYTSVPAGPMGCCRKSYFSPNIPSYADFVMSSWKGCSKLSVVSMCCNIKFHLFKGKSLCTVPSTARKWFLNVCIARSALLERLIPGGTSW